MGSFFETQCTSTHVLCAAYVTPVPALVLVYIYAAAERDEGEGGA